jgi:hypothetical protein
VVFPWTGHSCPAFDYVVVALIKPGVTVPVRIQRDRKDRELKVKSPVGLKHLITSPQRQQVSS